MLRTALVMVLLLGLAGCAGKGGGSKSNDPVQDADFEDLDLAATSTTGLIRGVVVDSAIRPLEGAKLTLQSAAGLQTATSSAEGLFGFDNLEPGTYFVSAAKPGYLKSQASVDVVAGVEDPPVARILLAADAAFKTPYYEQYVFDGFIECSAGAAAGGAYGYLSACSASSDVFPNDKFATSYVLSGYPAWVQSEMSWDSTQAVSRSLAHNFYYPDPSETDSNKDLTVEGESPLVNTMDNATAKEYVEGLDYKEGQDLLLRMRIFTRATDGTGPAVTIEQKFTVYTTVFYGYLPPEGWTLRETGEVPPPPR